MSWFTRLTNVLRGGRLSREIDEELQSHLAEAIEQGRDPAEARRAFGSALRHREQSHDLRVWIWLDSVRADAVFGWRQLLKKKTRSAAAILSLALAIGACTAAFRLIDAVLLRPMPVANSDRLYLAALRGMGPSGDFRISDASEYPLFQRMRALVRDQAEMIAVSFADRAELTFGSDEETEKVYRQYVSGWMFSSFGIQPAAGRLLTEHDDTTPGAHPNAVLSYDYWTRRFGQDPHVIGRQFRIANSLYQIVGVSAAGFTGTETGTFVDIFVPVMMNPYVTRSDASWFRPFVILKPGVSPEPVREKLHAAMRRFNEERAKAWTSQTNQFLDRFLNQTLLLLPAASGVSGMQTAYQRSLLVLGIVVGLVLLIACANVANLMTAEAASRAREMALRVSIGAGRARLVQLVLIESAWLGMLAALLGAVFAWWATPFVTGRIDQPNNPARLALPVDWRVLAFGMGLALLVTLLFGLAPALRASAVHPASALKGGDDPHSRSRLIGGLIAAQVAFCFIVLFAAALFVTTFEQLRKQSIGFRAEGLLTVETTSRQPQPQAFWDQVSTALRMTPGVKGVGLSGWPLLGGNGWNGFIWVNGAPTEVLAYFLGVSPEWRDTMGISLIAGRELRPTDTFPGAALVNEAFVKQCFHGDNPLEKWFEKETGNGVTRNRLRVVGVVKDARYRNLREPITPTVYVPIEPHTSGTFMVRTGVDHPMALASLLRREVTATRPEFHVSSIRAETELVEQQTVRERLLAMLATFFAAVALLLAGVGLYGVLDYSVMQRRRELGIRIAIGASSAEIARRVTVQGFSMVLLGAAAGILLGTGSVRYVQTLLYGVKATDPRILLLASLTILVAALLASLPAIYRALRIDPVDLLRSE